MSSRHKAREAVLKALYLSESRGISVGEAIDELLTADADIEKNSNDPELKSRRPFALRVKGKQLLFARQLAEKVQENGTTLNDKITPFLKNWDLARISRIDRLILWIALTEMTSFLDIPFSVSINEAIELAKTYSSEKSPPFINGVLDSASKTFTRENL